MFSDSVKVLANNGTLSHHSMIRHEKAKGLFIMLPGGNNAPDRPIMHYVRKVMLDAGYDVLNIDYTGLLDRDEPFQLSHDRVLAVVDEVYRKRSGDYRNQPIHLFGRSLGSIVGMALANSPHIRLDKIVIISPTSKTIEAMNTLACKVYFDPKDPYLTPDSYQILLSKDNIECKEYPGVGHNFETDNDINKTMDIMKDVVLDMTDYLLG